MSVPIIGILGGIGSGKSSVIRHVTEFQLQIIDADKVGHDLLQDTDILKQLSEIFPASVFDTTGQVIRSGLADRVFGDSPGHRAALAQLQLIVHPGIQAEIKSQIRSVAPDVDAIVLDAAILLESGWADECDHLVYIHTPESTRIQRVTSTRSWTVEEFQRRELVQLPVYIKKQRADFIIDNSGTIDEAAQQMTGILRVLINS
ncbi:MAG: dephospho-CoA kinase [Fuerstiella sp.]|nr:dephospho-CoA kinase [Fuerstiella sp.]